MIRDLYACLAAARGPGKHAPPPACLASGLVDECTYVFWWNELRRRESRRDQRRELEHAKNAAREKYRSSAKRTQLALPPELALEGEFAPPLRAGWVAIALDFRLVAPWYSRDDRPFHVLDNPVRKDRVFGVPYMSAASWKGLLRWAFHMHTGLVGPARERDERRTAVARAASVHLFGSEKGTEDKLQRGALVFYPTWFSKLDFEVINPHKRATRAGHQPILYEVVPADTPGVLRLLYAPLTSRLPEQAPGAAVIVEQLLDAAEQLLTLYGFSAKRTAGWSVAAIERVRAASHESELSGTLPEIKAALGRLLPDVEARV